MIRNVALLSMKELEIGGQGIPRYINALYNNSKKFESQYGLHVEKLYPKNIIKN